ncbi:MAG: nucleotidyltransferase domain-containing protein [Gemmatimonadetes bacterium]|nr:nucleotidyltransferase domain-containing protein [Gemmatimonadota bacterium]
MALGALERRKDGRRVRYTPLHDSPVWKAFRMIASASTDPTPLVRDAMSDVPGVQAAFIFGSAAGATLGDDSDIDVFVVEDATVDRKKLLRQLAEVELLLDLEVNAVRYTPQALAERLGDPKHPGWRFVRDTLAGPKKWVAGAASAIAPLAAAAGLRLPDLAGSPS